MSDSTYTDPTDSDKDAVRVLIGDTDPKDWMLTDGEIGFFLTQENSIYLAAAASAESCGAKIAREVSNSLEQASTQLSDQYKHFKELARQLRIDAQRKGDKLVVNTGGVTSTGTTRDPIFTLGMDDFVGEIPSESLTS